MNETILLIKLDQRCFQSFVSECCVFLLIYFPMWSFSLVCYSCLLRWMLH